MPIANMRDLLKDAQREKRAVGAFSVSSIEMIVGVLMAAEELQTPVILQVAEKRLATTPLPILGKAMLAAASRSRLPIAVHLDHGETMECIRLALDTGFTSVMYDGSALPMQGNVRGTLEVIDLAKRYGAAVEAEIGRIGKTETGEDAPAVCAKPEDCEALYQQTGVDALAVAIGNAHGVYVGAPQLHFDILKEVRDRIDAPLVLHGGTGISDDDFRRAASLGVCKINIATALFMAATHAATSYTGTDYFAMSARMESAAREVALGLIRVFGTAKKEGTHNG